MTTENCSLNVIERRVVEGAEVKRMAERCSDYNDSRSNCRNFNNLEIRGAVIKGEDLCNIEAHYSKWVDCTFEKTRFSRMEAFFAEFVNCRFISSNCENSNFSFAKFENVSFINSNLNDADFSFAQGNLSFENCMMERCTAQNGHLQLQFERVNAYGFEANFSKIELDVSKSNLRRAEFNDGKISGDVRESDMSSSEFCRSDLSEFKHVMCAVNGMDINDAELDEEISNFLDILESDEEV